MKANLIKLFVLASILVLAVIVIGGINTTSADVLAQGKPPTVALPTREGTKPPTLTATPTKPGVVPQVGATPVAPLKGATVTRTATRGVASQKASVTYSNPWFTSYQLVNLHPTNSTTITVNYYDANGNVQSTAQRIFSGVPAGGSVTVLQAIETTLGSGMWSAVASADVPLAGVVNQQLGTAGSTASIPPFSSYTAVSSGATSVSLPVIMYNWFGYYTEAFIMNVGSGPTNITISYAPTTLGGCTTGATGQTDTVTNLAQYAMVKVSQQSKSSLGLAGGSGNCSTFNGRFLGGATVTSTSQPVAVVVNQHTQNKLFTYNGFTQGGTTLLLPAYMRNFYNFYAAVTIANLSTTNTANLTLTYKSDTTFSNPANTTVTAYRSVPPGKSITIYDGPGGNPADSDLAATYDLPSERFFGSVRIVSDGPPIVAIVNQESTVAGGAKAGTYSAMSTSEGATKLSAPLIQSAFYGFYTSLTIQTIDGNNANVRICYTSDGVYSSVKNHTKCYDHTTAAGFLNRYEGPTASAAQSDILDDPVWLSNGQRRFIGSATIEVLSGSKIVAFVNSEASGMTVDAQYTYNAFVITP